MSRDEAQLSVPASESALASARAWIDETFAWLAPDVLIDLKLIVNELLSNSVRHGRLGEGDRIRVSLRASKGALVGSVCDSGPGFGPAEAAPGWGLLLIAKLASTWSVTRKSDVCCVEFEIEVPEPS